MPELFNGQDIDDPTVFDLGNDHYGSYEQWDPDRKLNPQYAGMPGVLRYGMTIYHPSSDPARPGQPCAGFVTFASDTQRKIEPDRANVWQVESWDPLTISPSVQCSCGDHGFIREGRWLPC